MRANTSWKTSSASCRLGRNACVRDRVDVAGEPVDELVPGGRFTCSTPSDELGITELHRHGRSSHSSAIRREREESCVAPPSSWLRQGSAGGGAQMSYRRRHRWFRRMALGLAFASVMFAGRASVAAARGHLGGRRRAPLPRDPPRRDGARRPVSPPRGVDPAHGRPAPGVGKKAPRSAVLSSDDGKEHHASDPHARDRAVPPGGHASRGRAGTAGASGQHRHGKTRRGWLRRRERPAFKTAFGR